MARIYLLTWKRYPPKHYVNVPVNPVCERHLFLLAHGMSGALCWVFRHAAVVFEALASTQCRLERSPKIMLLLQLCIQLQEIDHTGSYDVQVQLQRAELQHLNTRELCPNLPAVTPLTLLELCLAFPAVSPQHCCEARRPIARLRTRRSWVPPAGFKCTSTRCVKSCRCVKSMNPKNTEKITDSWECGREHNLRFWWQWHRPL